MDPGRRTPHARVALFSSLKRRCVGNGGCRVLVALVRGCRKRLHQLASFQARGREARTEPRRICMRYQQPAFSCILLVRPARPTRVVGDRSAETRHRPRSRSAQVAKAAHWAGKPTGRLSPAHSASSSPRYQRRTRHGWFLRPDPCRVTGLFAASGTAHLGQVTSLLHKLAGGWSAR